MSSGNVFHRWSFATRHANCPFYFFTGGKAMKSCINSYVGSAGKQGGREGGGGGCVTPPDPNPLYNKAANPAIQRRGALFA